MIHYQLRCPADHGFDGWFRSSAAFEAGAADGSLSCPACGRTGVTRALMAPAIGRAESGSPATSPPSAPSPAAPSDLPAKAGVLPDALRAALQRLRAEVERRSDYVGPNFATEARRIHEGDGPARNIHGEATPDEAEALAEDGIIVSVIPWIDRADG